MPILTRFTIALLVLLHASSVTAQASDDFGRRSGHPYLLYTDANVARLKERGVGELEGSRAVGAGHAVGGARNGGETLFEFSALGGLAEHAAAEDLGGRRDVVLIEGRGHEGDSGGGNGSAAVDGEWLRFNDLSRGLFVQSQIS